MICFSRAVNHWWSLHMDVNQWMVNPINTSCLWRRFTCKKPRAWSYDDIHCKIKHHPTKNPRQNNHTNCITFHFPKKNKRWFCDIWEVWSFPPKKCSKYSKIWWCLCISVPFSTWIPSTSHHQTSHAWRDEHCWQSAVKMPKTGSAGPCRLQRWDWWPVEQTNMRYTKPLPSMYGIFTYIWLFLMVRYGKCR